MVVACGRGNTFNESLCDHAEAADRTDHQLREVEPGGVLDHPAAATDEPTGAVDEPHADHEVADAAVTQRARTRDAGRDDAAERRSGTRERRVEREVLAVLGQRLRDLGHGRRRPAR